MSSEPRSVSSVLFSSQRQTTSGEKSLPAISLMAQSCVEAIVTAAGSRGGRRGRQRGGRRGEAERGRQRGEEEGEAEREGEGEAERGRQGGGREGEAERGGGQPPRPPSRLPLLLLSGDQLSVHAGQNQRWTVMYQHNDRRRSIKRLVCNKNLELENLLILTGLNRTRLCVRLTEY